MENKICLNCGEEFKPSKNDERIKFCSAYCRLDHRNKNGYMPEWYQKNKAHVKAYTQLNYEDRNQARRERYANDEEYRQKQKNKAAKYNHSHPRAKKDQHLRKSFGITLRDYEELLESQDRKCAICGRKDSGNTKSEYFFVDHNHKTGEIRGLLCSKCNFGIGQFNDDVDLLANAINYLKGDGYGKVVNMVQSKCGAR